ncbi:MAG: hypothetical protein RQ824_03225 [bacterium]|nr:hypothetical protein [bacterium]
MKVFYSLETLSLDDTLLIDGLLNNNISLSELLRPGWQGKYYRPVIDLSFFVEQYLWGGQPFGYRLTNVLIHAFNAILLYIFAKSLLKHERYGQRIAFFAASLFAVHPVTVESVAWISGRTDPLATFWSLIGLIFYLAWKNKGKWYLLILSFLSMATGVLAKEVAIATPAALAVLELFFLPSFGYKKSRFARVVIISSLTLIPVYLLFRSLIIKGEDFGLGFILENLSKSNIMFSLKMGIASIGFYFKKFLLPAPLNFTINNINLTFYAVVGSVLITIVSILMFSKKQGKYCFLLIWSIGGIVPAALISFTNVAWTPWAERYLYYSAAPFSIALSMSFVDYYKKVKYVNNIVFYICIVPLLLFAILTFNRTIVMSSNELLWKDSYMKSPGFMGALNGYAQTLLKSGNIEEAEKILKKGLSLNDPKHLIYLNLGDISYGRGDYDQMKQYYIKALDEARNDERLVTVGKAYRRDILSRLARYNLDQASIAGSDEMKERYYTKGINNLIEAYKELPYNFINYQIAKVYIAKGDQEKAAEYLERFIYEGGAEGYTESAEKLLKKIK